jgi:hypothetical protein
MGAALGKKALDPGHNAREVLKEAMNGRLGCGCIINAVGSGLEQVHEPVLFPMVNRMQQLCLIKLMLP